MSRLYIKDKSISTLSKEHPFLPEDDSTQITASKDILPEITFPKDDLPEITESMIGCMCMARRSAASIAARER